MQIRELSRQESEEFLKPVRLGRLACARNGQPYVTPGFFALQDNSLYSFSSVGKKITWMRQNPLVCVEFDEVVAPQNWTTVIVQGKYEEFPNTPEFVNMRQRAHELLQARPVWWEPAYVKTIQRGDTRSLEPLYFRILIESLSGHRGVSDAARRSETGWAEKILSASKTLFAQPTGLHRRTSN